MISEIAQTAQRRGPGQARLGLGSVRGLGGLRLFVGLLRRELTLRYDPRFSAHKLKHKFRCRGGIPCSFLKVQSPSRPPSLPRFFTARN